MSYIFYHHHKMYSLQKFKVYILERSGSNEVWKMLHKTPPYLEFIMLSLTVLRNSLLKNSFNFNSALPKLIGLWSFFHYAPSNISQNLV